MIGGLIIGHRDIGKCMINALESITGDSEGFYVLSNDELTPGELSEKIKTIATKLHAEQLFLFVDVYGGSCWRAAKMAKLSHARILSGVNLPMLLSFIYKRENHLFEDLSSILENDGKRGIINE